MYPGEKKDRKAYEDYVIEMQSKGEAPLPLEEWKKQGADITKSKITTAMSKF